MSGWEGHANRECGQHRSTGGRAWCFDCSEWCYPATPCARCEIPLLIAERDRLREALVTIAGLRQEADEWEHPDFDWRMLARKQERIARTALDSEPEHSTPLMVSKHPRDHHRDTDLVYDDDERCTCTEPPDLPHDEGCPKHGELAPPHTKDKSR